LPFYLLAIDAWLDAEMEKPWGYRLSVFYYLAAMLAKTSTVMLPAVLLLYCWWKRGRISRQEIRRMIPYAAIALGLGLITVYFQNFGEEQESVHLAGFVTRTIGAGTALCFYLGKFILPLDLMPIYPRWTLEPPSLLQVLTLPTLAALVLTLWLERKRWARHALFGGGFFLLNLLPVLGFVKMKYMDITWVADHLVYLPVIGLIGLVVAGVGALYDSIPVSFRRPALGACAVLLAWLGWQSHSYAMLYVNGKTLWTYTVEHNPLPYLPHDNLGAALLRAGQVEPAMDQYALAVKLKPDDSDAYSNWGIALMESGRPGEAIAQFDQALKIDPDQAKVESNLGTALMQAGRMQEAAEAYRKALQGQPDNAELHSNLGLILMNTGRMPEAIEQFEQASNLMPENAELHYNLGAALYKAGRLTDAIAQFEQALTIKPDDATIRQSLEKLQAQQKAGPRE
jgi:Flp pilus assembly protein TadD